MKLFLSWSGDRSRDFAKAVRDWMRLVLGDKIDFFLSDDDVGPGQQWNSKLAQILDEADLGLLCLTSESLSSQWIAFEAGWLAKRLQEGSVIPLLLDIAPEALPGPLSQFQSKGTDEKGMQDIIHMINRGLTPPENEDLVRTRAQRMFPSLLRDLEPIIRGKLGVVAKYIRTNDQPTLVSLYSEAERLVRLATKSIEVLTSGYYDPRQSEAKDIEAHEAYTDTLVQLISARSDLFYREIIQFGISQEPFCSNKAWLKHLHQIASLVNLRSNVNLRSMPPVQGGSQLIVDGRYLLLELAGEIPGKIRNVMGALSLQDSDGVVPQAVSRDFATYWDAMSAGVDCFSLSHPEPSAGVGVR